MRFSWKTLLNSDKKDDGLGTFKGIVIPNITMMFGVILFFRISLVTAYIGPQNLLLVGILSLIFMLITSLSASAISTNMQVKGGGIYFIASRALGIEIGGAIGLALFLSQVFSIALCTSGFAYSIKELYPGASLELLELATLVGLTVLSSFSTDLALKFQVVIFGCLLLSLSSVFAGTPSGLIDRSAPFFFPEGLSFWDGFAIIYPAFTGIEVGMAMSGALKRPGFSIAVGTPLSLFFSFFTYMGLGFFIYQNVPLDLLKKDPYVLIHFAKNEGLVFLGIWCATLSSCLGSLLGAPRMLQRLAEDGVAPEILARQFGPKDEPRYAVFVTCLAALFFTFFTRIDTLIPMLSMIALITYGCMNFAAFFGELSNSPSWRPIVRPPALVPFAGTVLALYLMFSISALWAVISLAAVTSLYLMIRRRGLEVNFQDFRENIYFFLSKVALNRLEEPSQHALNWHPQLLTFVASPQKSQKLIHIAHSLTRTSGVLTYATILPEDSVENEEKTESFRQTLKNYYQEKGITCYVEMGLAPSIMEGMDSYIRAYGFGPMQPNTILIGFPQNEERFDEAACLMETTKTARKNLILFKNTPDEDLKLFKKRNYPKNKTIHLWWDHEEDRHFELMLSYLQCLTGGIAWGSAWVEIHALAKDENAQGHLKDYLKKYITQNRLRASCKIHISEDTENVIEEANTLSKDAHLVFIGLKPLTDENRATYSKYLKTLEKKTPYLQNVLFVAGYETVDHSTIYE